MVRVENDKSPNRQRRELAGDDLPDARTPPLQRRQCLEALYRVVLAEDTLKVSIPHRQDVAARVRDCQNAVVVARVTRTEDVHEEHGSLEAVDEVRDEHPGPEHIDNVHRQSRGRHGVLGRPRGLEVAAVARPERVLQQADLGRALQCLDALRRELGHVPQRQPDLEDAPSAASLLNGLLLPLGQVAHAPQDNEESGGVHAELALRSSLGVEVKRAAGLPQHGHGVESSLAASHWSLGHHVLYASAEPLADGELDASVFNAAR
mmetsp:Transcript_16013/g.46331  ORF Transcript_16013/g.46331 Transcript_16013/m.46331 type:complete len:263 (+) Transcript_16013:1415-2203(+)